MLLIRRTVRPRGYASGPSLAAALLDGLFELPADNAGPSSLVPELFFLTLASAGGKWARAQELLVESLLLPFLVFERLAC